MKKILIVISLCLLQLNIIAQTQTIDSNLQLNLPVVYSQSKSFMIFGDGNDHVIQGQAWTGTSDSNVKSRIRFTQLGLELQYPETFNSFVSNTTFHTGLFISSGYNGTLRGNVGIGTTTPTNKLEILGCTKTNQLKIDYPNVTENWDNEWQSGFFDAYYIATSPETTPNWFWGINIGHRSNNPDCRYGGQLLIKHSPNEPTLYFRSRGQDGKGMWAKVINSVGNQQINGNLVVDGKLDCEEVNVAVIASNNINVSGTIQANDIRVTTQGRTADFVFADDYKLKSIDEIAQYVQKYKHLPDVPSAVQMEKEGVNLAEMNKLLLQKIEELTLYVIELENARSYDIQTRKELEQKVSQQQISLEALKNAIVEIKALLGDK
jgi:hypothetical protein